MRLIILKFYTIQDYVPNDIKLIWQLMNNVTLDDVNTLYIMRTICSEP
jgi:hypothetical protein